MSIFNYLLLHEFWVKHISNINLSTIKVILYVCKLRLICMHKKISWIATTPKSYVQMTVR